MSKSRLMSTALALCFTSAPAFADIAATELWDEWVAMSAAQGSELTAQSQDYSGGVLTLSGIRQQFSFMEVSLVGRVDEITLSENDDGSVSISTSPEYLYTLSFVVDGEPIVLPFETTLEGLDARVSGDDMRVYDIASPELSMDFAFAQDGVAANANLVMTDYVAQYVIDGSDANFWGFETTSSAALVTGTLEMTADQTMVSSVDMTYEDLAGSSEGRYRVGFLDDALKNGFEGIAALGLEFAGSTRYAASRSRSLSNVDGTMFETTSSSGESTSQGSLTASKLAFSTTSADIRVKTSVPELPFPVEFESDLVEGTIEMPIGITSAPAPVRFQVALREMAISDILWGLFDPTGQLPRDPVTVAVDVSASMTTFMDLTDVLAYERLRGAPGEVHDVQINELTVRAAGAELMGAGDLEMINQGSLYGPGVPQPVGKINLELNGAFGLIDKLIAMGFVPPEQGQMARMMSGMVARPVGDDQLVSEFEFTRDGGILANGLPLPF